MMDPAVGPFIKVMRGIDLKPPQIAYISNVTGEWITDEQATDPAYWGASDLRCSFTKACGRSRTSSRRFCSKSVRAGRSELWRDPWRAKGRADRSIVAAHAAAKGAGEVKTLLRAGAELWLAGVPIEWGRRYQGERRRKRPLPTYPFARQRYWAIEDPTAGAGASRGNRGSPGGSGRRCRRGPAPAPVEATI